MNHYVLLVDIATDGDSTYFLFATLIHQWAYIIWAYASKRNEQYNNVD